jgi:hypothetical protein
LRLVQLTTEQWKDLEAEEEERTRLESQFVGRPLRFDDIAFTERETESGYLAVESLSVPFRVMVLAAEHLPQEIQAADVHVEIALYHNGVVLPTGTGEAPLLHSSPMAYSSTVNWPPQWLCSAHYKMATLPASCRIGVFVIAQSKGGGRRVVAGGTIPLFDQQARLRVGTQKVHLWPDPAVQVWLTRIVLPVMLF